ncbi:GNAT family N-acetyltransferase [Yersinia kristensenii]|nr:GNAT family N-acetyltransferase [Yersinia kristensenii]MDA5523110.1 GNAT family N-acetyltransferase [Yersinia kristensenii]MDX6734860.1 GNAT family N-acetyltransferase [Yersinia kristensenii]PHZ35647.1 histone acetyltransferase [Yersinia kristensenii]
MNIEICQMDRFIPEIVTLINQLDAYQSALYPAESNHAEPIENLAQIKTYIYVAKWDSRIVGCATLALPRDSVPEVKRVFVTPDCRGHGIASLLMTALIDKANTLKLKEVYLETGVFQPEAISLYQRLGFELTAQFSHYTYDALSVFMVKKLDPNQ